MWYAKLFFFKMEITLFQLIFLPIAKLIFNLNYFLDFFRLNIQSVLIIFFFKLFYKHSFKYKTKLFNLVFYIIKLFLIFFLRVSLKLSKKIYFFNRFILIYIYTILLMFFFILLRILIFLSEFSFFWNKKNKIHFNSFQFMPLNFLNSVFFLNDWHFIWILFSYDATVIKYTTLFYFQCKYYKLNNYFLSLSLTYSIFFPALAYIHLLITLFFKYYKIFVKKISKIIDELLW